LEVQTGGAPSAEIHQEDRFVDDMKKTYREGEETAKENWRKADGNEDLADKVGNAGEDIRKNLGNAGDDARKEVDEADRDATAEADRR
jgi:hypothetical protein